jgi:hypothetical protein
MSAISILRRLVKIGTLSPSHHSEPLPFSSLRGPPFPLTVRPSLFRHCEPLPFFSLPSSCFLVIARHSSSRHCQALLFWSLPSTWFPVIARHSPSHHCEALFFSSFWGPSFFVIARHSSFRHCEARSAEAIPRLYNPHDQTIEPNPRSDHGAYKSLDTTASARNLPLPSLPPK